jgi:hypothetical protein
MSVFITDGPTADLEAARSRLERSLHRTASADKSLPPKSTTYHTPVDFYHYSGSEFGKDAPHITIGTSRRTSEVPVRAPGPGQYNPPSETYSHGRKIRSRFSPAFPRDTGLDYQDVRVFPQGLPRYIGTKLDKPFFDIIESPAPSYIPQSTLSTRSHQITGRTRVPGGSDAPSPDSYLPKKISLARSPEFSMAGGRSRDEWLEPLKGLPAPTDYFPKLDATRPRDPEWTIGRRSRLAKRRRKIVAVKGQCLVVNRFVFPIEREEDLDAAKKYLAAHPAVVELVAHLVDAVLAEKPDNPLNYFSEFVAHCPTMEDRSGDQ